MIRVVVNPLILWIWLGGILLTVGTVIALWSKVGPFRVSGADLSSRRNLMRVGLFAILVAAFLWILVSESLAMAVALIIVAGLFSTVWLLGRALFGLAGEERAP